MSAEIEGGATLWARQTIESEIFLDKPDKWFKIWFYLVNRVSHKDTKRYKRGETFYHQEWICDATGASPDQVKKCLTWLRDTGMISTRRSTRGTWLEIPKYSHFQTLDNYYYDVKAPDEARQKHDRSTTEARRYYKNDKNVKNDKKEINTSESIDPQNTEITRIIELFKEISPSLSYGNKTQRKACKEMLQKWPMEKLEPMILKVLSVQGKKFAPRATTPHAMWTKIGDLASYFKGDLDNQRKVVRV